MPLPSNDRVAGSGRVHKFSRGGYFCFLAALTAWARLTGDALAGRSVADAIDSLEERVVHGGAANLTVVGSNRLENVRVIRHIGEVARRMAHITGHDVPTASRSLYITVMDEPGGLPPVALSQTVLDRHVDQRLRLNSYEVLRTPAARAAVCRVLLGATIKGLDPAAVNVSVPDWLAVGLSEVLTAPHRAACIDRVLTTWQRAGLGPVTSVTQGEPVLARDLEGEERNEVIRAWYGAFVYFLSAPGGRKTRFADIFGRLGAGKSITAPWLAERLPAGQVVGLDDAWDRWLLRQRQVVHHVGTVSMRLVEQLRAELLLHPGACGIPLDAGIQRAAPLRVAVGKRNEPWIHGFVRRKRARLDMLRAGRATAFRDVVAAYCGFLDGVEAGERETELLRRLAVADSALEALSRRLAAEGSMLVEER